MYNIRCIIFWYQKIQQFSLLLLSSVFISEPSAELHSKKHAQKYCVYFLNTTAKPPDSSLLLPYANNDFRKTDATVSCHLQVYANEHLLTSKSRWQLSIIDESFKTTWTI